MLANKPSFKNQWVNTVETKIHPCSTHEDQGQCKRCQPKSNTTCWTTHTGKRCKNVISGIRNNHLLACIEWDIEREDFRTYLEGELFSLQAILMTSKEKCRGERLAAFVSKEECPLGFASNIRARKSLSSCRPSEPLERSRPGSVQRRSCLRWLPGSVEQP